VDEALSGVRNRTLTVALVARRPLPLRAGLWLKPKEHILSEGSEPAPVLKHKFVTS
jgi:hypothetical protein